MCIYYGAMQNYKNHAKFLPLFHFIAFPLVAAYWIYTAIQLKNGIDTPHVMAFIGALGVVAATFAARAMALTVQDRVIRLEMQLRLRAVLPASQHGDIAKLSRRQFQHVLVQVSDSPDLIKAQWTMLDDSGAAAGAPASQRTHACLQFGQRERLGHEVISAQIKTFDALFYRVACGEYQHGNS